MIRSAADGNSLQTMNVRGLTLLTRKVLVTRKFGTDAWLQIYRDVAGSRRCFRSLITPETLIPLPDYLAFHDELVRRFYNDDVASHVTVGRESARWALVEGPCKSFPRSYKLDLRGFVTTFPKFWRTYFSDTSSRSEASLNGDSVEFKALDLPEWHPYLEHFVMGYMSEALEMFCANPIGATQLHGGGGKGYHYLLHTAPAALDHAGATGNRAAAREGFACSSRTWELEVLLFVAEGKTQRRGWYVARYLGQDRPAPRRAHLS